MQFTRRLMSALFFPGYVLMSGFSMSCAYADNTQPDNIGNYALPSSQQQGAFLSFGQNTLDKGQTQIYLFADGMAGHKEHYIDAMAGIVYGFLDNLSIEVWPRFV